MTVPTGTSQGGLWLATWTLWRREMVRFLRQRSRVIGAFGTPVVFWLIVGAGVGRSLNLPGGGETSYLEFSFPGAIAAILLFTAIFSTISIIDDRKEGFLQGVLAAPVSRAAIALGKVLGATTLAVGQSLVFLLLGPFAGIELRPASVLAGLAVMVILSVFVTSLGFWIAWRMQTTQAFHAVMNLMLMPMLILSGAFFPPAGSAGWLRAIMAVNPMSYGVQLLRAALRPGDAAGDPSALPALFVLPAVAAIMFAVLIRAVTRESDKSIE
jgi:ABC-2 type transport system permease protein